MLPHVRKHQRLLFYFTWFTVNMLQAGQTELIDDEAYYWVYSRFPAWGYFDHPPMIAILIKAGFGFFHHELGVRLFIVMMNTATIFIIQELTEKKDDLLFYAVAGTVAVAQIGGIIAAPDIPLLFFVALFFWLYKRFLYQMNLLNSILVGAAMALMLYSKYHGVLIIFATILSNPSLLRKFFMVEEQRAGRLQPGANAAATGSNAECQVPRDRPCLRAYWNGRNCLRPHATEHFRRLHHAQAHV